jgi:hypothetical protein
VDPTFRMLASRERRETSNTDVVQREAMRRPPRRVILDIDSSESPVHGAQEQSASNGHLESVCYHALFVFNQQGDCPATKLRPGNVPSASGWEDVLLPAIVRHHDREQTVVVRADARVLPRQISCSLTLRTAGPRR